MFGKARGHPATKPHLQGEPFRFTVVHLLVSLLLLVIVATLPFALLSLVEQIGNGTLKTVAIDTPEPSPFSHEILNANPYAYLDDAPLEERRARAVQMRRTIGPDAGGVAALDPAAIAEVAAESFPTARDAEELHDALLTLVAVPPVAEWEDFFRTLRDSRRATVVRLPLGGGLWEAVPPPLAPDRLPP